ncbi:MAG: hypothetical protein IPK73_02355 [Candidatus Obscuribacter sp.]|nr:hypothetical protein [Candidatus Obscuribacter sp.]MBK9280161.1 hypothetical protein [Candidatus Obscuribacter sp.]MBL8085564.1 hypothetical protein [Candidatus Obscuribacter sp.]
MCRQRVRVLVLLMVWLLSSNSALNASPPYRELALKYGVVVPENNVENVGFEIKVAPPVARSGQPVKITFVVKNLSGNTMILPWQHMYARCFSYRVVGKQGIVFCDPEYGLAPGASGVVKLKGGETYSESVVWDQQKFLGPSDFGRTPEGQVSPGDYVIAASFNLKRKEKRSSDRSGATRDSASALKSIGGLAGISIMP